MARLTADGLEADGRRMAPEKALVGSATITAGFLLLIDNPDERDAVLTRYVALIRSNLEAAKNIEPGYLLSLTQEAEQKAHVGGPKRRRPRSRS